MERPSELTRSERIASSQPPANSRPLGVAIDALRRRSHVRILNAEVRGQIAHGVPPEAILLMMVAERQRKLVQQVACGCSTRIWTRVRVSTMHDRLDGALDLVAADADAVDHVAHREQAPRPGLIAVELGAQFGCYDPLTATARTRDQSFVMTCQPYVKRISLLPAAPMSVR